MLTYYLQDLRYHMHFISYCLILFIHVSFNFCFTLLFINYSPLKGSVPPMLILAVAMMQPAQEEILQQKQKFEEETQMNL